MLVSVTSREMLFLPQDSTATNFWMWTFRHNHSVEDRVLMSLKASTNSLSLISTEECILLLTFVEWFRGCSWFFFFFFWGGVGLGFDLN